MSQLQSKDLERNYEWKILSDTEQRQQAADVIHMYKTGITDTMRPVAI